MPTDAHPSIDIRLREITPEDLPILFEHQHDPEANRLAAVNPRSRESFDQLFASILIDPDVTARAITADNRLVGRISCFKMDAQDAVGYWIAKDHWGKGIATRALRLLLEEVTRRPLFARVATHNKPSIRVLQNCGFTITNYQHAPATERFQECEEAILTLD
jgi:RimJ/RimL family protein N-acetyltransferase